MATARSPRGTRSSPRHGRGSAGKASAPPLSCNTHARCVTQPYCACVLGVQCLSGAAGAHAPGRAIRAVRDKMAAPLCVFE